MVDFDRRLVVVSFGDNDMVIDEKGFLTPFLLPGVYFGKEDGFEFGEARGAKEGSEWLEFTEEISET